MSTPAQEQFERDAPYAIPTGEGNPRLLRIGRFVNGVGRLSPKLAGWIALQLFMHPRRIPMEPEVAAFMDATEQLKHRTARHLLHGYRWAATAAAPRVLLIHGWESHSGRWMPLIEHLVSGGASVTAMDGPAAGRSNGRRTPFNEYVYEALAFEAAYGPFDVMVGHSLGAGVVAQLASRVPADRHPRSLALMGAFDESEHVFERYFAMMAYGVEVRASFWRHIVKLLGAEETVESFSNKTAVGGLGHVRGLVLHSDDDPISPVHEALDLHAAWPNAELWRYADAGHGLTDPEVVERLAGWILESGPRVQNR